MKVIGNKPTYYDGGPKHEWTMSAPGVCFWVCSHCGEIYPTCDTVIQPPDALKKFRCSGEKDDFNYSPDYCLLLCPPCASKEEAKRSSLNQRRTIQR